MKATVDIDEVLEDQQAVAVLELWGEARAYPDNPPFAGGVLVDWPALAVDGFAVCRSEELAIDDFLRWKEQGDG